jgi:hypothetical protein
MKQSKLNSIAPILGSIQRNTGFKTPTNYFQEVEENVISTMKSQQLIFKKPSNSFKVPDDYFITIEDVVLSKLKAEVLQVKNNKETKIPENYFESIEDQVLTKLKAKSTEKKFSLTNVIKYVAPIAIAASLLLIFVLKSKPETVTFDNIATNEIVQFVENGFADLDTDNIVTIYSDVELSDNFTTLVSEEEAYDYLDEIDVESLIYEN